LKQLARSKSDPTMEVDQNLIFYEGKYILLKVLVEDDIINSGWVGWFNDANLSQQNSHHYFPNTYDKQFEYFKDCHGPKRMSLGIINKNGDQNICGIVTLDNIDLVHRNCEIAGILGHSRKNNNPMIFFEAYSIMLRHAFEELGLKKVYGAGLDVNLHEGLKRMFNFEQEGIKRNHFFKNGEFHDLISIAVFADTVKYPDF